MHISEGALGIKLYDANKTRGIVSYSKLRLLVTQSVLYYLLFIKNSDNAEEVAIT